MPPVISTCKPEESWKDIFITNLTSKVIETSSEDELQHRIIKLSCFAKIVKDRAHKWTVVHAFCAILGSPIYSKENVKKFFKCISQIKDLAKQILQKDADGDTPIMSALNSEVESEVKIKLIFQFFDDPTIKEMFSKNNKRGLSPLKNAFKRNNWGAVEVMLAKIFDLHENLSTECPLIAEAVTLLHDAAKQGCFAYFSIFLRVCRQRKGALKFVRKIFKEKIEKETIWGHLAHRKIKVIKRVLELVIAIGIDINTDIFTDPNSKTTLLHYAYRSNKKEFIRLLYDLGARDVQDANGYTPEDRRRHVDSDLRHNNQQKTCGDSVAVVHEELPIAPPCIVNWLEDDSLNEEYYTPNHDIRIRPNEQIHVNIVVHEELLSVPPCNMITGPEDQSLNEDYHTPQDPCHEVISEDNGIFGTPSQCISDEITAANSAHLAVYPLNNLTHPQPEEDTCENVQAYVVSYYDLIERQELGRRYNEPKYKYFITNASFSSTEEQILMSPESATVSPDDAGVANDQTRTEFVLGHFNIIFNSTDRPPPGLLI